MSDAIEGVPITHFGSILKGFLSGSVMASAVFLDMGLALQAVVFVIGLVMFLDAIIMFGEETHIATVALSFLISILVTFVLYMSGLSLYYLILVAIAGGIYYVHRFLKRLKKQQ